MLILDTLRSLYKLVIVDSYRPRAASLTDYIDYTRRSGDVDRLRSLRGEIVLFERVVSGSVCYPVCVVVAPVCFA